MGRLSAWLCPTDLDRTRVVEANRRVQLARATAAAAIGVGLVSAGPWIGWWTLILFAVAVVILGSLEFALARSARPELAAIASNLSLTALIAVGVALSGGPESPGIAWIVIPGSLIATRFRREVVFVMAGVTALAILAATVAVDPAAAMDNPVPVTTAFVLLMSITAVASALMGGELENRNRAVLDPLTGLLNRSSLAARVAELEQQARLTGAAVSFVVVDLDSFKRVNDTYGHDRGDAVLRDVAYEMRKSLRSFELIYRIGGEEFLILLPGVEMAEAMQIADRLRLAIEDARPGELKLTLSAGVAMGAGAHVSYDDLFKAADDALLRAKREGRNRVVAAGHVPAITGDDDRRYEPDASATPLP
jgi:diguanylate cyclase (GGDEF)-like protein